jgi:hypothetical protein
MPRVPRGPPTEPGILDIERDLGARDLLHDRGRRDLARDPGWRDLADDPGRQELQVLGASPEVVLRETFGISGGVLLLKRAKARSPQDSSNPPSSERPASPP